MPFCSRDALIAALLAATLPVAANAADRATSKYVSARIPIAGNGPSKLLSAMRPAGLTPQAATPRSNSANHWKKLGIMPGAVVHDIAFVSPTMGYAAAELGQIWQTTDGGAHWTRILSRGFPYYYYGIYVSGHTVIASGFNDQTSEGILTRSNNGGGHWKPDEILSSSAWADRVRFAQGLKHGLAMNGLGASGSDPNLAWWSKKGRSWNTDVPDPNGGWFGSQFSLLDDLSAYASGITFCKSPDAGARWNCAPPADAVFDGAAEFVSDQVGWSGGGEISPDVAGWVHRTSDGGQTWSDRVLNSPWPVREILFLDEKVGWAAGGNVYSNAGGIYYSKDGGKKWVLDADTGDEMGACADQPLGNGQTRVWCVGFLFNGSNFNSETYSTVVNRP
jgi:photosystem II stability/assembly factor-like uncharacterized protein